MKRSRYICVGTAIGGAFMATMLHAEPMYVHDKLVVSVYAQADQESEKVGSVESGDAVEVLEKADLYTRVQLSDGREGWIKSSYLSAQPPAILRLRELEKQGTAAAPTNTAELEALKSQNAALQSEVAALKQAAATPPAAAPAEAQVSAVGHLEGAAPEPTPFPLWQYLSWGGVLLAVGATLGFTWGYQRLARRIRRKYGNVRIY